MNNWFKRHTNEITVTLLVITSLAIVSSFIFMVSSIKKLSTAYGETTSIPLSLPVISVQKVTFSAEQYKKIQELVNADSSVRIEAKTDMLVISAPSVVDEVKWRRAVSDVLTMDKNLHATRVCGSANSACNGVSLVVEIVGQRQIVSITH